MFSEALSPSADTETAQRMSMETKHTFRALIDPCDVFLVVFNLGLRSHVPLQALSACCWNLTKDDQPDNSDAQREHSHWLREGTGEAQRRDSEKATRNTVKSESGSGISLGMSCSLLCSTWAIRL